MDADVVIYPASVKKAPAKHPLKKGLDCIIEKQPRREERDCGVQMLPPPIPGLPSDCSSRGSRASGSGTDSSEQSLDVGGGHEPDPGAAADGPAVAPASHAIKFGIWSITQLKRGRSMANMGARTASCVHGS